MPLTVMDGAPIRRTDREIQLRADIARLQREQLALAERIERAKRHLSREQQRRFERDHPDIRGYYDIPSVEVRGGFYGVYDERFESV